MVGHAALDRVIGVRIPASQPIPCFVPFDQEIERLIVCRRESSTIERAVR